MIVLRIQSTMFINPIYGVYGTNLQVTAGLQLIVESSSEADNQQNTPIPSKYSIPITNVIAYIVSHPPLLIPTCNFSTSQNLRLPPLQGLCHSSYQRELNGVLSCLISHRMLLQMHLDYHAPLTIMVPLRQSKMAVYCVIWIM